MTAAVQTWSHGLGASFGPGPWADEPDKIQWVDEATDLDCLAVRNHMGTWCGYVGVPLGHRCYGMDYDIPVVEVHGGLTFADNCDENAPEGHGICHIPLPGRPADVWWLGFDCNHAFDLSPFMEKFRAKHPEMPAWPDELRRDVYRDVDYVKAETTSLATQLASVDVTSTS